jgi:hypothetical protein
VAAGRPFRRPPWLSGIKALARQHGVAFLGDLGSDDERHLQAATPEDHCPFSFTAWPVPLPDYVICAIDLADGRHSDRILADARAGRLPWLKYMNFRGWNYSVKRGWRPVRSSDGHLHLSGRSDHTWTGLDGYDPFMVPPPAAPPPSPLPAEQGEDMKIRFVRLIGAPASEVWGTNLTSRWPLFDPATLAGARWQAQNGDWQDDPDTDVHEVDNLNSFGPDITAATPVVLSAADRAALVADLLAALAPTLSPREGTVQITTSGTFTLDAPPPPAG